MLCFGEDSCFIECDGDQACQDMVVFQNDTDADDFATHIHCADQASCSELSVCDIPREEESCPVEQFCDVRNCTGPNACAGETFEACGGVCMHVICDGVKACAEAEVLCKAEHPDGCKIECRGDAACFDMDIYSFGSGSEVHLWCEPDSCEGAQWGQLDPFAPEFYAEGCPIRVENDFTNYRPPNMNSYQSIAIITDPQADSSSSSSGNSNNGNSNSNNVGGSSGAAGSGSDGSMDPVTMAIYGSLGAVVLIGALMGAKYMHNRSSKPAAIGYNSNATTDSQTISQRRAPNAQGSDVFTTESTDVTYL